MSYTAKIYQIGNNGFVENWTNPKIVDFEKEPLRRGFATQASFKKSLKQYLKDTYILIYSKGGEDVIHILEDKKRRRITKQYNLFN